MTLQEALKSHKPFRRVGDKEWLNPWYATQEARLWHSQDVLAEYEVYEEEPTGYQLYAGNGNPKQWTKIEAKPRVFLWEYRYPFGTWRIWQLDQRWLTEEQAKEAWAKDTEYRKSRLSPENGWSADD